MLHGWKSISRMCTNGHIQHFRNSLHKLSLMSELQTISQNRFYHKCNCLADGIDLFVMSSRNADSNTLLSLSDHRRLLTFFCGSAVEQPCWFLHFLPVTATTENIFDVQFLQRAAMPALQALY